MLPVMLSASTRFLGVIRAMMHAEDLTRSRIESYISRRHYLPS
jgi:hypothetical protein